MTSRRWNAVGAFVAFVGVSVVAGVLVAAGATPAVAVSSVAINDGTNAFNGLPDYLQLQPLDQRTTIYAQSDGHEVPIAGFYAQNRRDVALDQMANSTKTALIDTEDPRFYSEGPIDLMGTLRAALADSSGKETIQGGSSITQQYVKNILIQRCDEDDPVDGGASTAVQEKQQSALDSCDEQAAGDTLGRKIHELRYAIGLNKEYSKNDILQSYLNIVGFGGQVYGIQAAAQYYFGVDAKSLSLDQSATLVAILNNPNYLRIDETAQQNSASNPQNGFKATLDRRNYVLQRMLVHGSISEAEYQAAVKQPIQPKITPRPSGCQAADAEDAGFFCSYVQDVMLQNPAFGATQDERDILFQRGGLKVYTTLNLDLQASAQSAINDYIPSSMSEVAIGSSNVSVEVGTGRIVTMVENKQYDADANPPAGSTSLNFNTDVDYGGSSGFQTGSSFKAFSLIAWLEAGHALMDMVDASHHLFSESDFQSCTGSFGDVVWPVADDEGGEGGEMTVLEATEDSVNTAFAEMGTKLNLCSISDAAQALGVHSANQAQDPWTIVPPFILGTNNVAPLSMAAAYAGIADGGRYCTPVAIDKVIDSTGKSLPVPQTDCKQVIPENVAATVDWGLQHVLTDGTATTANPNDGVPIMGKTGTTDSQVQNWLVTSTTKVAQATWVGQTEGEQNFAYLDFGGYAGNNVKFPIVKKIDTALDAYYGGASFPTPDQAMIYGDNSTSTSAPTSTPTSAPTPTSTGAGSGDG